MYPVIKDLLDAPTLLGMAALAIVGILFILRQALSIFQATVFPRAYQAYLEHRQIILPFADKVLDRDWKSPTYFRDGGPKLIDFRKGFVFIRPEVATIESRLHNARFTHIEGTPSSGKTVIALTVAYNALTARRTVLYFSQPSTISDTFITYLSSHAARRKLDKHTALLILDDVHLDISVASKLFSLIYNNYSATRLLYITTTSVVDDR